MTKVDFIWSDIYQENIHLPIGTNYDSVKFEKESLEFIEKVKLDWCQIEKDMFKYMEKITGLSWKLEDIKCYFLHISSYLPISDPLTISINLWTLDEIFTLSKERFIDMLVHELIHNLFIQNKNLLNPYFKELLNGRYGNFSVNTACHIPVHAIHEQIFLKFFGEKRLAEEIESCKYYPDYKESWKIVRKIKGLNIIQDMKKSVLEREI